MVQQLSFFREHRIQLHRVGDRHRPIRLAGAPPQATGRSLASAARPAQLSLYRFSFPRPGGRVGRPAVRLRAFRSLRRHRCGDTRAAFAVLAAARCRRCRRMDFQSVGFGRSRQCFLSGQCRRPRAGTARSRVFHSDPCRAATADHARTRVPDSSATEKRIRVAGEPPSSMRELGQFGSTVRGPPSSRIRASLHAESIEPSIPTRYSAGRRCRNGDRVKSTRPISTPG